MKKPAPPKPEAPLPQQGGSFVRMPDGSLALEQTAREAPLKEV
jgi:hypothetical protein